MEESASSPRRGRATDWTQYAATQRAQGTQSDSLWHQILAEGLPFLLERQAEGDFKGPEAACVYCFRDFGPTVKRNRLNRYYCDDCDTFIRTTPGQAEVTMPTLVVDVRNATGIEQGLGMGWVRVIRSFRRSVSRIVQLHHGFVMDTGRASLIAVFPPGFLPLAKRGATTVAAEAIAAAGSLAEESPSAFVGDGLPYGVGLHSSSLLVFSVSGEPEDEVLAAEEGEFDPAWVPAVDEPSGPVSIDLAGDAIVVACELAEAAAAGEALITRATDIAAGDEREQGAYQETRTKAATVAVRSVRSHQGSTASRATSAGHGGVPTQSAPQTGPRATSQGVVPISSVERLDRFVRLNVALNQHYEVQRELGQGGMAVVYLATDVRHQRRVALKVLKTELTQVIGPERFLAEIKTMAKLQHPHILPLHDSGEADGLLYYVMPHVTGESLRDWMDRERRLPVDVALRITISVARALDYAHRQGVVHRDIKPGNILIQDGEPVVADFGIALAISASDADRLTGSGMAIGTSKYMSPEQATGDGPVGPASDTYSLACVLYEMLSGDPPHTGSPAAVLVKMLTQRPVSIRLLRDTVPPHVEAALERALAKTPADRPASAEDFAQALAAPSGS